VIIDRTVPRPISRWHGGKWRLAPWVIAHFGPHRTYVEPFGGAASVLLRKPRARNEVYNDLDRSVVNLFRVLQDPSTAVELQRRLYLTPYAREEWEEAERELLNDADPVERARRLLIRAAMSWGSDGATRPRSSGFRARMRSNSAPSMEWASWPETVPAIVERLRGVVIENRDALELIPRLDDVDTLFYGDPPYPMGTRSAVRWESDRSYRHELTDEQHRELAQVLRSVRGMVVLSGYGCELYDEELYPDWHRTTRAALADGARARTECLWLNPAAVRALERLGGGGERKRTMSRKTVRRKPRRATTEADVRAAVDEVLARYDTCLRGEAEAEAVSRAFVQLADVLAGWKAEFDLSLALAIGKAVHAWRLGVELKIEPDSRHFANTVAPEIEAFRRFWTRR
jgi:DNA adenine methylase